MNAHPSDAGLAAAALPDTRRLSLQGCGICGTVQRVPGACPPGARVACARCGARLHVGGHERSMRLAGATALGALALYTPAMILPVLEVQRLGHARSATIWSGVVELMSRDQVFVGTVVLVCSIVIPVLKIVGIIWLSGVLRAPWNQKWRLGARVGSHARARTLRAIEWLGRWGMVDVLLVAVLIAAVKLGSVLQIHAGPGIAAFAGVVILSMLASAFFDPRAVWEQHQD